MRITTFVLKTFLFFWGKMERLEIHLTEEKPPLTLDSFLQDLKCPTTGYKKEFPLFQGLNIAMKNPFLSLF